jgi:hypothetical protein
MIFTPEYKPGTLCPRPITGVSLDWVFLNEVLSSRARLRFPSHLRFFYEMLGASTIMQRTEGVQYQNCLTFGVHRNVHNSDTYVWRSYRDNRWLPVHSSAMKWINSRE